jgi:hypothetical protein
VAERFDRDRANGADELPQVVGNLVSRRVEQVKGLHVGEVRVGVLAAVMHVRRRPALWQEDNLLTPTSVDEERYFASTLLHACGPRDLNAAEALARVTTPSVGIPVGRYVTRR